MTSQFSKLADTHEPVPRQLRRRVGVGVLLLVCALTGGALFKQFGTGAMSDTETDQGIAALSRALAGNDGAFDEAEGHFVAAASHAMFDRYPVFLVHVGKRLRASPKGDGPQDAVVAEVARGDFDAARRENEILRTTMPEAAELWHRLLIDLESRQ